MDYRMEFERWMTCADTETQEELENLRDDDTELRERFAKYLEFGTGGLRGIIGAGTNRMNKYTVAQATQGMCNQLLSANPDNARAGVAIAYDSRHKSEQFAKVTACVLAANGIKAYLFDELRPTPELSFAVRHLKTAAGIVITASHNPAKYNGYKAYGSDGAQLSLSDSETVLSEIRKSDIFDDVKLIDYDEALAANKIILIGEEVDKAYLACVKAQSINPELTQSHGKDFKLIYTPFHGSGNKPVRRILDMCGFNNVLIVKEQEMPNGAFPTVKSPNPEEKEGFRLAIDMAQTEDVDLIIGTDPDGDRVGIVVKDSQGEYVTMTGNQVGVLLTEYILSSLKKQGKLPSDGMIVKTIVTTDLVRAICAQYGANLTEVLTGFKFIGEKIYEYEKTKEHTYLFGFEESYGYLCGTYARDKDAVVASMLIAEMALYYKVEHGRTLYEQMERIYEQYGYYIEEVMSIVHEGLDGAVKIKNMMTELRNNPPKSVFDKNIIAVRDYLTSVRTELASGDTEEIDLPKSDVLYYELEDNCNFIIRPSGTEPKIKLYCLLSGKTRQAAEETVAKAREYISKLG